MEGQVVAPHRLLNLNFEVFERQMNLKRDEHLTALAGERNLRSLAVKGATATFIGQTTKALLQILSLAILARLLLPEDFGLIAMVTAVTGFIMVFKDLGLSTATIQRQEVNQEQISTLFWINVGIGAALMFLTVLLAPSVGWFYGDDRVVSATGFLSVGFLLTGFTVQHNALLRRRMKLVSVAIVEISSMVVGLFVAIACALADLGYWSLVYMNLAIAATSAIGVWVACDWRPTRPTKNAGIATMLVFGGDVTLAGVLNYVVRNSDNIIIGRSIGAEALGLYSRAYSLLMLPIGQLTAPLTAVAVPVLSRLQSDSGSYSSFYLRALKTLAYCSMPIVTLLGSLSHEIIAVILGSNWESVGSIFKILSIAAFFSPVGSTVGWLYISSGQTRRMLIWTAITAPITVVFFLIGSLWGVFGIAASYSILVTIQIVPQFWFAVKSSSIELRDVLATLRNPILVSIGLCIETLAMRELVLPYGSIWTLVACSISSILFGFAVAKIFPPIMADLRHILSFRDVAKKTI